MNDRLPSHISSDDIYLYIVANVTASMENSGKEYFDYYKKNPKDAARILTECTLDTEIVGSIDDSGDEAIKRYIQKVAALVIERVRQKTSDSMSIDTQE